MDRVEMIVNTHGLQEGDVVKYYGCIFKLRDKRVFSGPRDIECDPQGTVSFRTDLVHWEEGSMPLGWAETWSIQGNSRATWRVIGRD